MAIHSRVNQNRLSQKVVFETDLAAMMDPVVKAKMMAEDKNVFISVGAGHLSGPGSVVALLKENGYKVKQK